MPNLDDALSAVPSPPAPAKPAKRKARTKEERADELLKSAAIDRAIDSSRKQLDVIRVKLRERDFDGAIAMTKLLFEQMAAELPVNARDGGGDAG